MCMVCAVCKSARQVTSQQTLEVNTIERFHRHNCGQTFNNNTREQLITLGHFNFVFENLARVVNLSTTHLILQIFSKKRSCWLWGDLKAHSCAEHTNEHNVFDRIILIDKIIIMLVVSLFLFCDCSYFMFTELCLYQFTLDVKITNGPR